MKLSIETCVMHERYGGKRALEMIKSAGFDAYDYSMYCERAKEHLLDDSYAEYAKELRAYADSIGLECNQAHAPFDIRREQERTFDNKNYLMVVRSIESAAILGAKSIVVHALCDNAPVDHDYITDNYGYYKLLEPYAEKFGIKIAVENLFRHNSNTQSYRGIFGTPKLLGDFVKRLGTKNFCACIDLGHSAVTGCEPEYFIRGMSADVLGALHVQDTDYLGDRHDLPLLEKHNWQEIMSALKEIGYTGEFTFEILTFLRKFDDVLLPDALVFAEKVGRRLTELAK